MCGMVCLLVPVARGRLVAPSTQHACRAGQDDNHQVGKWPASDVTKGQDMGNRRQQARRLKREIEWRFVRIPHVQQR